MKSVFAQEDNSQVEVKRNPFDLSFQNNLTMNFGKLYPVMCKEVVPGDGFKIDAKFALNLLPMVFPVQTKLQARLDFYYVRNRALWKDWKDFVYHTKENLSFPVLSFQNAEQRNLVLSGSLGDYLNLPTQTGISTDITDFTTENNIRWTTGIDGRPFFDRGVSVDYSQATFDSSDVDTRNTPEWNYLFQGRNLRTIGGLFRLLDDDDHNTLRSWSASNIFTYNNYLFKTAPGQYNVADSTNMTTYQPFFLSPFNLPSNYQIRTPMWLIMSIPATSLMVGVDTSQLPSAYAIGVRSDGQCVNLLNQSTVEYNAATDSFICKVLVNQTNGYNLEDYIYLGVMLDKIKYVSDYAIITIGNDNDNPNIMRQLGNSQTPHLYLSVDINWISQASFLYPSFDPLTFPFDGVMSNNPFIDGAVSISALPFRAYEAIYNCWYRNEKVDPFVLNGEIEYNRFNTNLDGGLDDTPYDFFWHNWERDFLTTCLPSPQQGEAPLVGVRVNQGTGDITVDVNGTTYVATPQIGADGETITGMSWLNDAPEGAMEMLQQRINQGFSINDLRAVDSFQRWLETNLRRGYKYRDLIYAHTGERVHYNELDMPEYLGGVSDVININKIVNTNGDGSTPLGEFAGLGSLFSGLKNGIDVHCDEHGFIMGIMSVVPVPVYTQLLPKHFLKLNELDFYNKEFQRIGMQPVYYDEVSPNERYHEMQDGQSVELTDVFGYQRPYYEYMSSQDEAHGLFRTNLQNYVLSRYFDGSPELSRDFIIVKPEQLNNVFPTSYDEGDKILGQIYFDIIAKRPMLRNAIPSL